MPEEHNSWHIVNMFDNSPKNKVLDNYEVNWCYKIIAAHIALLVVLLIWWIYSRIRSRFGSLAKPQPLINEGFEDESDDPTHTKING